MGSISTAAMFAGNSRYANDFKAAIDRSVAIASLPMHQLQAQKTALQDQSAELTTLDMKLASLNAAVEGIGTAAANSYAATVSDNSVLTASAAAGALAGSYTVEVTDLGSYNNTMSLDGLNLVKDPSLENVTDRTNFTLSAGGETFSFTAGTLNEMAAKINGSGLAVQASLVNVGSESAPDYRLSVQGTKLGSLAISLQDDATPAANELVSTLAAGAKAAYKVNGFATPATSESRTVEIAPGLKINLLGASAAGKPATVTVSRTADPIANALASFVNAYNAAVDEVDKNRGASSGALAGQGIVYSVDAALSDVLGFSPGSGPFSSLEDLGLSIGLDGKLLMDRSKFDSAVAGKTADLLSFVGAAATGGFLKNAGDALNGLEDPDTGSVRSAMKSVDAQIKRQDDQIARQQEGVDALQVRLNEQMAAADALIALLEQQATYMTNLFQAMLASAQTNQ